MNVIVVEKQAGLAGLYCDMMAMLIYQAVTVNSTLIFVFVVDWDRCHTWNQNQKQMYCQVVSYTSMILISDSNKM